MVQIRLRFEPESGLNELLAEWHNLTKRVTADNLISELLSAPLSPGWTVDRLAEEVLCAIAAPGSGEAQEFVLDAEATTDRQSRRILRPLLAFLANQSAAEAGTSPNLYSGRLSFQRPSHEGSVWILGQFENMP